MKYISVVIVAFLFLSSCTRQEPILQSELNGIWKLNGYASSNYKMEITPDGYLYWFNYNDIYNRIEEFEMEFESGKNQMKLYCGSNSYASHLIRVYKNRNNRLYFTIPVPGTDAEGNSITNYNTYYKMN